MSGDAGRRPLSVAATHATGASVCRQPEPSLRAPCHQPPPPRSSRQMPTIVVASIASVVSHTALRAPVNDRCTKYGCLATDPPAASRDGPPRIQIVASDVCRRPQRPTCPYNASGGHTMAIIGAHALLYTSDPNALRTMLRDAFGFRHVDAGDGWLIFALPPAELGVHPAEGPTVRIRCAPSAHVHVRRHSRNDSRSSIEGRQREG